MSLHLPRPVRRSGVVVAALAALVVAGAGTASAHVTVSSPDAAPGGYGKFTFRVPNESDSASTVGLRIQLPTDHPITSMRAEPVPGWTVTLTTGNLPEPVKTDDGDEITTAVTVVEYRADAGGGIAPGQFQEFSLSGGPVPDVDSLTFNAVQTYSDGTESAWIEPTVEGQGEPEHPAPTLRLTGDTAGGQGTTTAAAPATDDDGGNGTAVAALVVGIAGLLAGLAGLFLGLTARRRTVKP
ncbi:YcnI family protein [Modestobacter sp. NPDC049651]|uniref:YcnI family copper-binding membrane protein n=1 Tax=unclassified Modestobacter TaxID=2643866 RepID=UPI0033F3F991